MSSLRKMEKDWESAARSNTKIDDAALKTVFDTMSEILWDDCTGEKENNEQLLKVTLTDQVDNHSKTLSDTGISGLFDSKWTPLCTSGSTHNDCRDAQRTAFDYMNQQCGGQRDPVVHECSTRDPMCACAQGDRAAATVLQCLKDAKDWSKNFNDDGAYIAPGKPGEPGFGGQPYTASITDEADDCDKAEKAYITKQTECNGEQSTYESDWCTFGEEADDLCSNYNTNFGNGVAAYKAELEIVKDSAARNKEVCYASKKVQCWLNVIATNLGQTVYEMNTDTRTGVSSYSSVTFGEFTIANCQAYVPDCEMFNLDPPTIPDPVDCANLPLILKSTEVGLPSSAEWVSAYYEADPESDSNCKWNVDFVGGRNESRTC